MQQFDANTFIDDTLVTCAEYQLFIDEMMIMIIEYFQPDHWTALQFQSGEANTPILGVRRSDASSFCEWLTQCEETGEWHFRLPTSEEAKAYPPPSTTQSTFGYWTEGNTEETKFAWFGPAPRDARKISCDLARSHDCKRPLDLDRMISILRDTSGIKASTHNRVITRYIELEVGLALARPRVMDLTHANAEALARTSAHDLSLFQDWGPSVARDLAQSVDNARNIANEIAQVHDPLLARARDIALDIYIDLYTLQERIAGRSPAFEGIRLVKERRR